MAGAGEGCDVTRREALLVGRCLWGGGGDGLSSARLVMLPMTAFFDVLNKNTCSTVCLRSCKSYHYVPPLATACVWGERRRRRLVDERRYERTRKQRNEKNKQPPEGV